MAMIIVIAGDTHTGIDHQIVTDALGGKNSVSVMINGLAGGQVLDWNPQFRHHDTPPLLSRSVSAVGYLDMSGPWPRLHLHTHRLAARQLDDRILSAAQVRVHNSFGRNHDDTTSS
jgi:hypothetical protein